MNRTSNYEKLNRDYAIGKKFYAIKTSSIASPRESFGQISNPAVLGVGDEWLFV